MKQPLLFPLQELEESEVVNVQVVLEAESGGAHTAHAPPPYAHILLTNVPLENRFPDVSSLMSSTTVGGTSLNTESISNKRTLRHNI